MFSLFKKHKKIILLATGVFIASVLYQLLYLLTIFEVCVSFFDYLTPSEEIACAKATGLNLLILFLIGFLAFLIGKKALRLRTKAAVISSWFVFIVFFGLGISTFVPVFEQLIASFEKHTAAKEMNFFKFEGEPKIDFTKEDVGYRLIVQYPFTVTNETTVKNLFLVLDQDLDSFYKIIDEKTSFTRETTVRNGREVNDCVVLNPLQRFWFWQITEKEGKFEPSIENEVSKSSNIILFPAKQYYLSGNAHITNRSPNVPCVISDQEDIHSLTNWSDIDIELSDPRKRSD